MQSPVPLQAPPQPRNVAPGSGCATRTVLPDMHAEQIGPQSIGTLPMVIRPRPEVDVVRLEIIRFEQNDWTTTVTRASERPSSMQSFCALHAPSN